MSKKEDKLPAEGVCAHLGAIENVRKAKRRECEDCIKIGGALGSSPDMPGVRGYPLLRQLAESAREQARGRIGASRDRLGGARRALAVLLPRRRLPRILNYLLEETR